MRGHLLFRTDITHIYVCFFVCTCTKIYVSNQLWCMSASHGARTAPITISRFIRVLLTWIRKNGQDGDRQGHNRECPDEREYKSLKKRHTVLKRKNGLCSELNHMWLC